MCPSLKFAWDGTVCMATMLDNLVMVFQFSARTQIPMFYKMLKMALDPTQNLIQWAPRAISRGMKLTTCLQILPRLGLYGAVPPLPLM